MRSWENRSLVGFAIVAFMVSLSLLSISVSAVMAQDEGNKGEAVQEGQALKSYELEGITVTAEKRGKNIQEIPSSITALSEIQIEDAKIVDTEDLIYHVPNLFMIKTGNHGEGDFLSIRGITPTMAGVPTVGFFVDDIYYTSFDIELFDKDQCSS